jgi:hypothetical protein
MTTSTAAVRRFRQRQKSGKAVLQVQVDLFQLTEMLISSGFLRAWDDHDRAAVEDATERLLAALAAEKPVS